MSLKILLSAKLPKRLQGQNGTPTIYTIGQELGYRPQTISEWFRKDQINVTCVYKLMTVDGHSFELEDFAPYCTDLKMILDLGVKGAGNGED